MSEGERMGGLGFLSLSFASHRRGEFTTAGRDRVPRTELALSAQGTRWLKKELARKRGMRLT